MKPVSSPEQQGEILRSIFDDEFYLQRIGEFEISLEEVRGRIQLAVRKFNAKEGRPLLYLRTHTGRGGVPAALIAERNGEYYLLHDTRVRKEGYGKPSSATQVSVNDKIYAVVGRIDQGLFEKIIRFHLSRSGHPTSTMRQNQAYDPGPRDVSSISAFERNLLATHHKVCVRLFKYAQMKGWKIIKNCKCRPDLAVERNGIRILFEVKPIGDRNNIACAIGQLLIYNEEINANRKILIAPLGKSALLLSAQTRAKYKIEWVDQNPSIKTLSDQLKHILN